MHTEAEKASITSLKLIDQFLEVKTPEFLAGFVRLSRDHFTNNQQDSDVSQEIEEEELAYIDVPDQETTEKTLASVKHFCDFIDENYEELFKTSIHPREILAALELVQGQAYQEPIMIEDFDINAEIGTETFFQSLLELLMDKLENCLDNRF